MKYFNRYRLHLTINASQYNYINRFYLLMIKENSLSLSATLDHARNFSYFTYT